MRELKIVGLDLDGKHVICEGENPADKYRIRVDDRLRAAVRGDGARVNQTHIDIESDDREFPHGVSSRAARRPTCHARQLRTLVQTGAVTVLTRGSYRGFFPGSV